jgi:hypothetical protein
MACEVRIEPDCLIVVRNRGIGVTRLHVGVAAVVEGVGIFRIEPNRLVEVGDRAVVPAFLHICGAAVEEGEGILRIELDHLAVVGDRAVVVAFLNARWDILRIVVFDPTSKNFTQQSLRMMLSLGSS